MYQGEMTERECCIAQADKARRDWLRLRANDNWYCREGAKLGMSDWTKEEILIALEEERGKSNQDRPKHGGAG